MPDILPTYGPRQQFRYRVDDLTFPGVVHGLHVAPQSAVFCLNGAPEALLVPV